MFWELTYEILGGVQVSEKDKTQYFTRFPNHYIQCNISKTFGVSRKFYITYILIDRYRSYEDYSWITVRKILNFYGYKTTRNKPKAFREILDVLEYMVNNGMIEIAQDLDSVSYDTGIEIKINPKKFDCPEQFTKLTAYQLDWIINADTVLNKECLLIAFIYINSYIGYRKVINSKDDVEDAKKNPRAFWKSMIKMSEELAMSKDTLNQCVQYLSTGDEFNEPLLKKHITGYANNRKTNNPENVPNIYVLNEEGYEQEIRWAINKMLEVYQVDHFFPHKSGN